MKNPCWVSPDICLIGRISGEMVGHLFIQYPSTYSLYHWQVWKECYQDLSYSLLRLLKEKDPKVVKLHSLSYFGDLEGETLECAMKGIILETRCGICQLPWWSLYASTTENLWRFLLPFQRQIGLLSQSSDSSRRGFSQCGCPSHEGRVKIVLLLPPFFLFEMKRNLYWIG